MIIQRLFSSKEQKARVAQWRKSQTGKVEPASIQRHGKTFDDIIEVSREGDIENNRRRILKERNLDPLAIKEEQSRTITYNNKNPRSGPIEATFKYRKGLDKILEKERESGYKNAEIKLDQVYKDKVRDLKKKKMLKKGGKIALATGGVVVAAGIGAKKLADKKKAKKDDNSKK